MTKKAARSKKKIKKPKVRSAHPKVWRIFHFEQRFEMDSYRRRGGLDYVRMFVTATTQDKSNESSGFIQQLTELEHFYPEMRDTLEGRFWRLCRLTATQEDWLRGYLLDAEQKPLTPARLAARLHLDIADLKKTLTALKRVGLIEQVECPAFEKPKRDKSDEDKDQSTAGTKGKSRVKGKKTGKKPAIPKRFKTFSNVPNPLNNKIGIESKKNNKEKDLELEEKNNQTNNRTCNGGTGSKQQTTHSPTTTPPASPTSPDATGGIGRNSRRVSPQALVKNCEPIGAVVDLLRFRYDADSLGFADEMLVRMGFVTPYEMERIRSGSKPFSPEQANERAHWAKAWCDCKSQFDDHVMLQLRDKIFKRTNAVRTANKSPNKPGAYLMTAWNNLVRDVRRKCKAM